MLALLCLTPLLHSAVNFGEKIQLLNKEHLIMLLLRYTYVKDLSSSLTATA